MDINVSVMDIDVRVIYIDGSFKDGGAMGIDVRVMNIDVYGH